MAGALRGALRRAVAEVPAVGVRGRAAGGRAGEVHRERRVARGGVGTAEADTAESSPAPRSPPAGRRGRPGRWWSSGRCSGRLQFGSMMPGLDVLHRAFHRREHVARRVRDVAHVVLLDIRRRTDDDQRHAVGVADVVGAVVAVLRVILSDDDQRIVFVCRVVLDGVDDVVGRGVIARDVLVRAWVVVEQLDVVVGRQPVGVDEVDVVVGHGGVRDVLAGARVLVVVQLVRDGRCPDGSAAGPRACRRPGSSSSPMPLLSIQ